MYPNDDTGNVLADMADAGIDLSIQHDVVFFQLFEEKSQAEAMADFLQTNHPDISFIIKPDEIPNVWDLDCTVTMLPSYDGIVEQEQLLEKVAAQFNGYNDGWGIEA